MPRTLRKNSGQGKKSSERKRNKEQAIELSSYTEEQKDPVSPRRTLFSVRNIILASLLILIVVGWKFKGYFIAATVNGQPISRWELNEQLMSRFGGQTLDTIINEKLILAGIRQKGVLVTTQEMNDRIKQIEGRLNGKATLSEALTAQGLTESMFRRQIEIQISIEKQFDKETTVSAQEITDYVSKNGSLYQNATDQAQVREEIQALLKQQKLSDVFDAWFSTVRKDAKILKFL